MDAHRQRAGQLHPACLLRRIPDPCTADPEQRLPLELQDSKMIWCPTASVMGYKLGGGGIEVPDDGLPEQRSAQTTRRRGAPARSDQRTRSAHHVDQCHTIRRLTVATPSDMTVRPDQHQCPFVQRRGTLVLDTM